MYCFNKNVFVTTVISQGSEATCLRCGGQCNNHVVANFLMNSTVKKIRKICQNYRQKYLKYNFALFLEVIQNRMFRHLQLSNNPR